MNNDEYTCGSKIKGGDRSVYSRWALHYGNTIESQSYNSNARTKDDMIETNGISSGCYVGLGPLFPNKTRQKLELCGKTPLILWRICPESVDELTCLGACKNMKQAKQQKSY